MNVDEDRDIQSSMPTDMVNYTVLDVDFEEPLTMRDETERGKYFITKQY